MRWEGGVDDHFEVKRALRQVYVMSPRLVTGVNEG